MAPLRREDRKSGSEGPSDILNQLGAGVTSWFFFYFRNFPLPLCFIRVSAILTSIVYAGCPRVSLQDSYEPLTYIETYRK
jgi:hypothetical protein